MKTKRIPCPVCGKLCEPKYGLATHMRKAHDKPWTSPTSGEAKPKLKYTRRKKYARRERPVAASSTLGIPMMLVVNVARGTSELLSMDEYETLTKKGSVR